MILETFTGYVREVGPDSVLLESVSSGGEEAVAELPIAAVPEWQRLSVSLLAVFRIEIHDDGRTVYAFEPRFRSE